MTGEPTVETTHTHRREHLRIATDAGPELAVTVHLPEPVPTGPTVVAFGFPGGSLSRGYFDVEFEGDPSYSQAGFHTARGWVFVAVDHLGVGDSDPESGATYETLAAANASVVAQVAWGLGDGTLIDGLPPIKVRGTIGFGHSAGGCISIVAQGNHSCFDALGVLGFSAIQTVIPTPTGTLDLKLKERDDASADLDTGIAAAGGIDMFRWAFHWEDVDPRIVDADMGSGYPRTGTPPSWGSPTTPLVVFSMITPGVVASEAAAIVTPVLVAAGERDVIPDVRAEAGAYPASTDLTLVEIPTMAHMHNLAGTRQLLWDRLHRWGDSVFAGF
jgi:pimeloyl-ACP methyl ester carboxylesterase